MKLSRTRGVPLRASLCDATSYLRTGCIHRHTSFAYASCGPPALNSAPCRITHAGESDTAIMATSALAGQGCSLPGEKRQFREGNTTLSPEPPSDAGGG